MTRPADQIAPPPDPSPIRLVAVMGAVGLIASVLLVGTYQLTIPYIEANRAAFLEQAVFDVLPGAARRVTFIRTSEGALAPAPSGDVEQFRVHAGYDESGQFVGVAIEAQGQGFQDVLSLLYGYVPDCECVVGMRVLASKETPGLGDKIETDPVFKSNFERLDASLNAAREGLEHEISLARKGTSPEAWQVSAITGATISSKAVATIINDSAEDVLPLIQSNLDVLRDMPEANSAPDIPETPTPPGLPRND